MLVSLPPERLDTVLSPSGMSVNHHEAGAYMLPETIHLLFIHSFLRVLGCLERLRVGPSSMILVLG